MSQIHRIIIRVILVNRTGQLPAEWGRYGRAQEMEGRGVGVGEGRPG